MNVRKERQRHPYGKMAAPWRSHFAHAILSS
jgi:hypothetical protein